MKFLFIASLSATTLAAPRTSPPAANCLVVSKSPTTGQHATIGAAVAALSKSETAQQCIFIQPGTYAEQVLIPATLKSPLVVYGSTTDDTSYKANTVTVTSSLAQAHGLSNDETGTLRVKTRTGFRLYNVNVNNGYGKGSQAVALSVQVDSGYYGCAFTGFQDTLLANEGRQYFARCLVQGATDFVFGRRGISWFEGCDVRVVSSSIGYVTASGRQSASDVNYYVFNNCNVAAASGHSVANGAYYLGRPWAAYARVVFQRTEMSPVINSAGWRVWNAGDERTSNVLFGEYGNTGPGAQGTRASFTTKLSSPVTIESILGSGYATATWFDTGYMR